MSTQEKLVMKLIDEICDYDEYCGDENCKQCGGPIKFWKKKLTDLIDSAKREAYKQGYIDAGIKALTEQSEESKLSACCGAEITETGFCTDCKDNC